MPFFPQLPLVPGQLLSHEPVLAQARVPTLHSLTPPRTYPSTYTCAMFRPPTRDHTYTPPAHPHTPLALHALSGPEPFVVTPPPSFTYTCTGTLLVEPPLASRHVLLPPPFPPSP